MDMLLKGKRALITGSTSGIGAQCARVLAGEGVSVVINGRNADRAAAVTEEIRKVGGEAKFVLGDVTTEDGSNAVIGGAISAFDGIDILVNNVGNPTQESHGSWFDSLPLFRGLLFDHIASLCHGYDPDWCRGIRGAEERYVGLVIGEILIDAPERGLS
jgi:NAD(P)-dependent dehydrogenase (short-subunit alcohol dehydrogenase family)